MTTTLKQRHQNERLKKLNERVINADKQLIAETRVANMLIEAMNEKDLQDAANVIDKLRSMKGKGLGTLDAAIDKAVAELNKYTGGGTLAQAWSKLKTKVGIDNPLVKVMTFADALEHGFKSVPTILKNNIGEIKPDMAEKSINDVVQDQNVKNTIVNNILKALRPQGIFASFKNIPYVDDMKVLAQDMLSTPLKNLNMIVKQATSGTQAANVAPDMKDIAQQQGAAETKGTAAGTPEQPAGQTTQPTPATSTNVTTGTAKTGEQPIRPPRSGAGGENVKTKVKAKVKPALQDLGIKNVDAVINALDDLGVLKAP